MSRLLVLIFLSALFAIVYSCAPTKTAPRAPATNSTGRRKRSAEDEVVVILVTNKNFDESTKDRHYELVNSTIHDYQKKSGNDLDIVWTEKKLRNYEGKFAVEYKVRNNCDEVAETVKRITAETVIVTHALVMCNGEPVELL